MQKPRETIESDWVISLLGIALALSIAIGVGFLLGTQSYSPTNDMSSICQHLPQEVPVADCIALRSTVAQERATAVSQLALWLSFGTLVASIGALVGLITAFFHGRRTILLAVEANRISMINSQSQARAYVVIQSVWCKLDTSGVILTKVQFRNSGLTPARQLRWDHEVLMNVVEDDHNGVTIRLEHNADLESSHWRQDISAAEAWTSVPRSLPRPNSPNISNLIAKSPLITVTIKIVADYQDVFCVLHNESACFQGRIEVESSTSEFKRVDRSNDGAFEKHAKQAGV